MKLNMSWNLKTLVALSFLVLITSKVYSQKVLLDKTKVLQQINQKRTDGCMCGTVYYPPVQPLKWNDTLAKVAYKHSLDMVQRNYYSHYSLEGKTVNDRTIALGYKGRRVGENIAEGYESTDEVMTAWFESIDHCANMMHPDFKEIGVGVVAEMWTMVLGIRMPKVKLKK